MLKSLEDYINFVDNQNNILIQDEKIKTKIENTYFNNIIICKYSNIKYTQHSNLLTHTYIYMYVCTRVYN